MWWIVWLVICIASVVLEAASPQLTSIWFALGGLAALITSFIKPDLWWLQLLIFVIVSAAALAATRPLAKKLLSKKSGAYERGQIYRRGSRGSPKDQ